MLEIFFLKESTTIPSRKMTASGHAFNNLLRKTSKASGTVLALLLASIPLPEKRVVYGWKMSSTP
jgi:hypothetical protein